MDVESLRTAVIDKNDDAVILSEEIGPEAAPVLIELLDSEDAEVRDLALGCITLTGYDETARVLAGCLGDEDEGVRIRALQSLQSRYDGSILDDLIENLANRDRVIRGGVARLMGQIGDTAAVKPLTDRLDSETDMEASEQMKLALARLGDEDLQDEFASQLDTPTAEGRYDAIRDLEYIGDRRLATRLLPALDDTSDAYEIGAPDEAPRFARVCDAAVSLIAKWFDKPFSFSTDDLQVYSEEEIEEARRFLGTLEQ
jgi:HEAT repeat protein